MNSSIIIKLFLIQVHTHQQIYFQGSKGDKFYIILSGQVAVFIKNQENKEDQTQKIIIPTLKRKTSKRQIEVKDIKHHQDLQFIKYLMAGESFGELALINNRPRLASIIASQSTHMAVLRKKEFNKILKKIEEHKILKEMGFFAQLPLFKNWNLNLIRYIYLNSFTYQYRMNQIVFEEGEQVQDIYIVKSGEFSIEKMFSDNDNKQSKDHLTLQYENEMRQMKNVLKAQSNKPIFRKITTQTQPSIIAIEDILMKPAQHSYSCICLSANGELIAISNKDFWGKLYLNSTSKQFIDQYCEQQKLFVNQRIGNLMIINII